jgi:hypothetical protein
VGVVLLATPRVSDGANDSQFAVCQRLHDLHGEAEFAASDHGTVSWTTAILILTMDLCNPIRTTHKKIAGVCRELVAGVAIIGDGSTHTDTVMPAAQDPEPCPLLREVERLVRRRFARQVPRVGEVSAKERRHRRCFLVPATHIARDDSDSVVFQHRCTEHR